MTELSDYERKTLAALHHAGWVKASWIGRSLVGAGHVTGSVEEFTQQGYALVAARGLSALRKAGFAEKSGTCWGTTQAGRIYLNGGEPCL